MKVAVHVTLKPGILDPQGQAVAQALRRLGFAEVADVRVGKYIEMKIDSAHMQGDVRERVEQMCRRLLANPVLEDFSIEDPTP
ncbi:MAG: phosphoribosylformylglycinamidine synthase subunit PurS [Myxococcales bacterium]|nr:phosphoribosylformylglycinamidine synthase subunit PurS [Myxococcota bacterium]MDW8284111.1 phosphoribosylformylglycinamidine synthase subunit PurS [Myxococcales bacterium]